MSSNWHCDDKNCICADPASPAPVGDGLVTDAMVEVVAKALCRESYPGRSLEEYLAPKTELWMRLLPEARIALNAALPFFTATITRLEQEIARLKANKESGK